MKSKEKLIIGILIVVGILVATIGVTYSLFNYTKRGSTESVINAGEISFYYDEMTGRGVSIKDALPIDSNDDAKSANNYFEFRITANTKLAEIPYVLTVRLTEDSNMSLTGIRVYLTKVNDGVESEVLYTTLDQLVEKQFLGNYTDKVLYRDRVGVDGSSYEQKYRLRIWIDEDVNFSTGEWNDKKLSLQVNVYTNEGEKLTEEHITYPGDTRVKMITANSKYLLAESTEENIDYEVVVPNEVTQVNFDTVTKNALATVSVTPLGTTPVTNSQNYNLAVGSNYFKITVTSADNTQTKDYKVKVERKLSQDNTLTYLEVEGYAFTEEFDKDVTNYTVSNGVEAEGITISANNPNGATITGTGEKTLSWGENTFNVTVQAQDPTVSPKIYTITVNNVRPTAPEIGGGTGEEITSTNESETINIVSPGTAISGVDHYEYLIASESTTLTDSTIATGTTQGTVVINTKGTSYVYYRTVSTAGYKSSWTSAQVVKIEYPKYINCTNGQKTDVLNMEQNTECIIPDFPTALEGRELSVGSSATAKFDNTEKYMLISGTGSLSDSSNRNCQFGENLKAVKIDSGITSLGSYEFYGCDKVTSISIPSTITSIGDFAFGMMNSLSYIHIPSDNVRFMSQDGVLIDKVNKSLLVYPIAKEGTSYTVPDGIVELGGDSFARNTSITTVTLPNSLTSIGDYAFNGAINLQNVNLPDGLRMIGKSAFFETKLVNINIPSSIESIDSLAFYNSTLASVTYNGQTYTSQSALISALKSNGVKVAAMVFTGSAMGD